MKSRGRCLFVARMLLVTTLVVLAVGIADSLGFNGVLVLNLNAELGIVRQGQEVTQVVHIVNYTLRGVSVLSVPTCGCTVADNQSHTLNPFTSLDVPISYRTGSNKIGTVKRDVHIIYRTGGEVHHVKGTAHFTVEP